MEQEFLERTALQKQNNGLKAECEQSSITLVGLQKRVKELEDMKKGLITPK